LADTLPKRPFEAASVSEAFDFGGTLSPQ